MSQKRLIKFHLVVFVVLLFVYIATLLFLFQKNSQHFNEEVYAYSKNNIMVIDALSMIGTNLYIHKKALLRFVNTQESKWADYMRDAQQGIIKHFDWLEDINKETFELWVAVPRYRINDAESKLKNQIIDFQKGRTDNDHFQRLFYLVRFNLKLYFDRTDKLIQEYNAGNTFAEPDMFLNNEEQTINLIYSGINQLVTVYNELFWDHTLSENSRYHKNTRFYFQLLMVASVILLLYALILLARIMKYFYTQRAQDQGENLALLGAQDLSTGLFNKTSFEKFADMEISRAHRRSYYLTLLMIRIEPYQRLLKTFGESATNLIIFQVAIQLQKISRAYDGVYRYKDDCFAILMPETNRTHIKAIIDRFKSSLAKDPFLIKNQFRKDHINIGFSCYPADGKTLAELVLNAETQLTPLTKAEKTEKAPPPLEKKEEAPKSAKPVEKKASPEKKGPVPSGIDGMME